MSLKRTGPPENGPSGVPRRSWLHRLQEATSLIYLGAGAFLIYQYWNRSRRQSVLMLGAVFVIYGIYRFLTVGRSRRRFESGDASHSLRKP